MNLMVELFIVENIIHKVAIILIYKTLKAWDLEQIFCIKPGEVFKGFDHRL